jgi:glycosyltransferase involved in cell wall biosynthesis
MIAAVDDIHSLRPLNWLLNRGCDVVFSSHFNPFPEGRDGYSFRRFPKPRGGLVLPKLLGEKIGAWLFRFSELTTALRLKMLWRRIRPTLAHVHWVDDRAHYCVKAGFHPLVLTVWGSDINNHFLPNANPASRRRVGETLAGADLILIDSADMHKKCAELAGREVATELFSLGVNTDRFHPGYAEAALEWRHRLSIPVEATVLLSIRGWSPLYRHESILEAFAQALPQLNSETVLVFKILKRSSMDRASYEKNMRRLADKLGVAQRVRWMEAVPLDQLPEIYSFADVVLNYPSMDAFPVTFFEAAACECPVISCRLPAYTGTFAEEYFRLVSSDDLCALSDEIVEFVNKGRTMAHKQSHELRRLVCQKYDERIVSRRLVDIYIKLSLPS